MSENYYFLVQNFYLKHIHPHSSAIVILVALNVLEFSHISLVFEGSQVDVILLTPSARRPKMGG